MSDPPDNSPPATVGGRSRAPRFHHRARSHESAHAGAMPIDGQSHPLDHPLVPPGDAELVRTAQQLGELVAGLRAAGSFAYDSEFIGEQSYIPKLCLIQVAMPRRVALIDPLEGLDLTPFWEVVCDAKIEKVVHAGQQDVEPVFRLVGRPPANLFDTQIAAGMVSLPYPLSLSKLVYELVGAKLGKGLTFTSWDQRPLSGQQLRYAADDVRYLPAARQELRRRLEAAGTAHWASQESNELCHPGVYRFNPDESYLKIRGANGLEPRNLAVLRQLAIWRDNAAREADVPPRTFLRDEIMLNLARSPVKTADKLNRVRGLPKQVEVEHGSGIIAATQAALNLPASQWPQHQHAEPLPREKFQCDAIWAAGQSECFSRGVDPSLVGSRQELGDLWRDIAAGGSGDGLRIMHGWRHELLGEKLLKMIHHACEKAAG
jgi:ribonuclease D